MATAPRFFYFKKGVFLINEEKWLKQYNLAALYCKENNTNRIPKNYMSNGYNLGNWYQWQLYLFKTGELSAERIELFGRAGLSLTNKKYENWLEKYNLAIQYCKEKNRNRVPYDCVIDNIKVGEWYKNQIFLYNKNKLPAEKINLLKKAGFPLIHPHAEEWLKYFNLVIDYCKENKCNRVPCNYAINGLKVGKWFSTQLHFYNTGRMNNEKIDLFEKAGISLMRGKEENWWKNYHLLIDYYKITSDKTISYSLTYKGVNLGAWCQYQRACFRNGTLLQERIDALNSIEFPFEETPLDTQWLKYFNAVKKFFEQTGGNYIPMHTMVDGLDIWYWGRNQKTLQHNESLPEDRYELLKSINFSFDEPKCMGSSLEESVLFYYIQKTFPNAKQRDRTNNFELDIYFEYNNQKIGIEYDGSHWHKNKFDKDLEKAKKCEERSIILFDIRFNNCGSLQKDTKYYHEYLLERDYKGIYKSDEYQIVIKQVMSDIFKILNINSSVNVSIVRDMEEIIKLFARSYNQRWLNKYEIFKDYIIKNNSMPTRKNSDKSLYSWIRNQLTSYRENRLTSQQIELLEELVPYGFRWANSSDMIDTWEAKYNLLVEYQKINNHVNLSYYETYKDVNLGYWLSKQRKDYYKGTLSPERIKKLKDLGFLFENRKCRTWEENYAIYIDYCNKFGCASISRNKIYKNLNIYKWVHNQKKAYQKGILDPVHKEKLDSIDFNFEIIKHRTWDDNYHLLIDYKKENLHISPSYKEIYKDIALGLWVFRQRSAYHKGTLSPDRIDKLEAIGFLWESPNKRKKGAI